MNNNINIKPCPFCGGEVVTVAADFDRLGCNTLKIYCDCGVTVEVEASPVFGSFSGDKFRPGPDAIEKWNRRVADHE